jgi:hypothetical protein
MKNTMLLGPLTLLFAMGSVGGNVPGCGGRTDDGAGGAGVSDDGAGGAVASGSGEGGASASDSGTGGTVASSSGAESASASVSGSGAGGASPTAPPLTIESVVNAGSRCPEAGAVSVIIDPATGSLLFTYSPAELAHPPGPGFQKSNCTTGLVVHGLAGWQLVATNIHSEGHAHLPIDTSGQQRSTCSFAGSPSSLKANNLIDGVFDDDYSFTGVDGDGSALTSGCGEDAIFNVDVSLILQAPLSSQGSASIDVKKVAISLAWQGC